MENAKRHYSYRSMIAIYLLLYLASSLNHQFILTTLLNPLATFLVCYGLYHVIAVTDLYMPAMRAVRKAFILWFVIDVFSTVSRLLQSYNDFDLTKLYIVYGLLYFVVRIMLFTATIQFYMTLTKRYNRFQRFVDIFTIICCVISTMWIIFFADKTQESVTKMISLDFMRIFSEAYRLLSMMILGILLISWFYYQHYKIALGQRMFLAGIAGIVATDLSITFYNSLIDTLPTNIIYKVCILLVAIGCEMYFLYPTRAFFLRPTNNKESLSVSWKNTIYFLSYPALTIFIVGIRAELILYVFLFAFYIVACLYVKQLHIVDALLKEEKEKNEQLMLYSNVIEQAPLSIVITDTSGTIHYVNPYFTKITGYSPEEAIGKNPNIIKSGRNPKELYEHLWQDITNGKAWTGEFINTNKYGTEFQERAVITPIAGTDGRTVCYVGIKENITEAQEMKNTINDQSQFIIQFADLIPNSIFHVDQNDLFVGANSEFRRIYQIDTTLYHGKRFEDTPWMNPTKYNTFIEMREESIRTKSPVIRQIVREAFGIDTPVLYCVNAYYKSDGTIGGYIGMMTNIAELKEKETALQNALLQANAATEAKSMFLANMSHEIRTPMNAIIGMSYLALKTELTVKQRDYIQKINGAATSLLGIINDILDFSKIESGKVVMESIEFDLDQVMTKSIDLLLPKAREKNLEFIYHLACNIPHLLKGDPLRLGQIITNLVSNAVKFTHIGEIRVDVSMEKQVDDFVYLKFSVSDTGIGIRMENQNKLFEAFTQSDTSITRQYGGTGLGLAICKNLVELMEGKLWIESEENKGSTFYFTAWFGTTEIEGEQKGTPLQHIKNIKTLIADDNHASRGIMKEYMEHLGIKADIAKSSGQAIRIIRKEDENAPYHERLIRLSDYLRKGDFSAVSYFDSQREVINQKIPQNASHTLETLIKNYEFEEAFLMIEKLLEEDLP